MLTYGIAVLLLAAHPEIGIRVSGPKYDGIVASCGSANDAASCWVPTPAEIAALEVVLERSLSERHPRGLKGLLHPLHQYKRQYLGFKGSAGAIILVTGYHRDREVVRSGQWLTSIITVSGGGGDYFRGRFLVAHSSFEWLSINAPA